MTILNITRFYYNLLMNTWIIGVVPMDIPSCQKIL